MEFPWDIFGISLDSIGSIEIPWDATVMPCDFIGFYLAVT